MEEEIQKFVDFINSFKTGERSAEDWMIMMDHDGFYACDINDSDIGFGLNPAIAFEIMLGLVGIRTAPV